MIRKMGLGAIIAFSVLMGGPANAGTTFSGGVFSTDSLSSLDSAVENEFTAGAFDNFFSFLASAANLGSACGCSFSTGTSYTVTGNGTLGSVFAILFGQSSVLPIGISFSETKYGGGHASFMLTGFSFGAGGRVLTDAVDASRTITGNYVSVPGPIAGAGLPVLAALGGFAAWRRKKASKIV